MAIASMTTTSCEVCGNDYDKPFVVVMGDPAGYLVVYADRRRGLVSVEHFTNAGVLTCAIDGATATALYSEVIARGLVSRLDHAAYLGRELARAEHALLSAEPYVQDRAPGEIDEPAPPACGCSVPTAQGPCGG